MLNSRWCLSPANLLVGSTSKRKRPRSPADLRSGSFRASAHGPLAGPHC